MAATTGNTDPLFIALPLISSVLVTAANTSSQGGGTIGTDIFLVETAGADGTFWGILRLIPTATAPTTTTATVMRIFFSTQSSGATSSANTYLFQEVTLAAIPADNATTAVTWYDVAINQAVPTGMNLLVTNHAAPAANTAWRAIILKSGDY